MNFLEATTSFTALITRHPSNLTLDSLHMARLERLTVLRYSENCTAKYVNEARKLRFTQGLKSIELYRPIISLHSHIM